MATEHAVLAVTGLKREARILTGDGVCVIIGGGDQAQLAASLARAAAGAIGIISIGLAGALQAGLRPGDWVVARAVVDGEARTFTDPDWTVRLADLLPNPRLGEVSGSDLMIAEVAAKSALYATTRALAVDMESHIAARVATAHGLPFAVARVISDGADHALPPAAQRGMRPDGGMDVMAVLASLAGDPRQLPALIRTALAAETAFRALVRGRQLLGPALGGPDLG